MYYHHNCRWGTICHKRWNNNDGQVACRQLGFGDVSQTLKNSYFGSGTGKIWFSRMDCTGSESTLFQCDKTSNVRNCHHGMDASVICNGKKKDI